VSTTRTRKALVAVAVIGALGVGTIVPALAQDTDDGDTAAAETLERRAERDTMRAERRAERDTMRAEHRAERGTMRAEHRAAFAEALAAELGLDVDEVAAALDAVHEQHRSEHAERRAEHAERRAERQGEAGEPQRMGPAAGQPDRRGGAGPRGPAFQTEDADA
jgi:hypothetical protein